MKIGIIKTGTKNNNLIEAFCSGLKKHNDIPIFTSWKDCFKSKEINIFVRPNLKPKIIDQLANFKKHNKRFLLLDTGFTHNKYLNTEPYYSVGFDNTKRYGNYYNENSPPDRWQKLNLELKPWKTSGKYTLLLLQGSGSTSIYKYDIINWYKEVIKVVGTFPLIIRPHPRKNIEKLLREKLLQPLNIKISYNKFLQTDLEKAKNVIAFVTSATVTCVIEGIPVFICNDKNMAWNVSAGTLENYPNTKYPNRTQWAYNLAYAQWNLKEITNGECWAHLKPHIKND